MMTCVFRNDKNSAGGMMVVPQRNIARAGRARLGNLSSRKERVTVPSRDFLPATTVDSIHAAKIYQYRAHLLNVEASLTPSNDDLEKYASELQELQKTLKVFGKSVVQEKMVEEAKKFGWEVKSGSSSSVTQLTSFADMVSAYTSSMMDVKENSDQKSELVKQAFVILYGLYRVGHNYWLKAAGKEWLGQHKLELLSGLTGKRVDWVYATLIRSKDDLVKMFRARCMRAGVSFPMETRPRSNLLVGKGTGWRIEVSNFGYNMEGYTAVKEDAEKTASTEKMMISMMLNHMTQVNRMMMQMGVQSQGSTLNGSSDAMEYSGNLMSHCVAGPATLEELASPALTGETHISNLTSPTMTNTVPFSTLTVPVFVPGMKTVGTESTGLGDIAINGMCQDEGRESIESAGTSWDHEKQNGKPISQTGVAAKSNEAELSEELRNDDQKTGNETDDSDRDVISEPGAVTFQQKRNEALDSVEEAVVFENRSEEDVPPGEDISKDKSTDEDDINGVEVAGDQQPEKADTSVKVRARKSVQGSTSVWEDGPPVEDISKNKSKDEDDINGVEVTGDQQPERADTSIKVRARKSVQGSTSVWEDRQGKRDGERLQVGDNNIVYACCIALCGNSCDYALCQECRLELLGGVGSGRSKRAKRGEVDGKKKVKDMWYDGNLEDCSDAHEVKMLDPEYDRTYFTDDYLEANKGNRPATCACCCVQFTNEKV